jgi:hypothetical protein
VTNYDGGHPETGGTNVIAWMQDDLGFEIDPHNHAAQSEYNLADVAALVAECGAEPTGVVGGFIAYPPESNEWSMLQGPLTGAVHTAYTWTPRVLWGAATKGHDEHETNLWFSGIYCPAGTNDFWTHAPGHLPLVGGYGGKAQVFSNLDLLLARRDAGELCTGSLYTVNFMANMGEMDGAYILDFLDNVSRYTNVPNVRFVTIGELTNVWAAEYGGDPSHLPWRLTEDLDGDGMNDGWEVTNFCGISAADGESDGDGDGQADRDEYVAGTDPGDAGDRFELIGANGRGLAVWTAVTGRMYTVEVDGGAGWVPTGYSVTGAAPLHVWTNLFFTPHSWCRVRVEMP